MSCASLTPLLSRYVDAELSRARVAEIDSHLDSCEACRWTVTLLLRERLALEAALRGRPARPAPARGARRMVAAAAAAFVLLGGALLLLHQAYRRVPAGSSAAASRTVLVRAKGMPLREFLTLLSEESGVSVTLEAGERADLTIDLELVEPIGLGSVLGLLEDFHGLHHRVEAGRILIRRGKEVP